MSCVSIITRSMHPDRNGHARRRSWSRSEPRSWPRRFRACGGDALRAPSFLSTWSSTRTNAVWSSRGRDLLRGACTRPKMTAPRPARDGVQSVRPTDPECPSGPALAEESITDHRLSAKHLRQVDGYEHMFGTVGDALPDTRNPGTRRRTAPGVPGRDPQNDRRRSRGGDLRSAARGCVERRLRAERMSAGPIRSICSGAALQLSSASTC